MAMEQLTNYKCDRCGRSELKDDVTILTLTVRHRAGNGVPGQGKTEISQHICLDNCLSTLKRALIPVSIPGRYDRKSAAEKRQTRGATKGATKPTSQELAAKIVAKNKAKGATKGRTKKASMPASATQTALTVDSATDTRADTVRAVRAITRKPDGGWAKGYNPAIERRMIAEREALGK